eukprot:1121558-Amphidinium_carterae.1
MAEGLLSFAQSAARRGAMAHMEPAVGKLAETHAGTQELLLGYVPSMLHDLLAHVVDTLLCGAPKEENAIWAIYQLSQVLPDELLQLLEDESPWK